MCSIPASLRPEASLSAVKIPQIVVPEFWLAEVGEVEAYLSEKLSRGRLYTLGGTTHGRPLQEVEYPVTDPAATVMIIGGTHGHEPGTVAATLNLLQVREQGEDLAGKAHPRLAELLAQTHLKVALMLNPDGHGVCPVSFYAGGATPVRLMPRGCSLTGAWCPMIPRPRSLAITLTRPRRPL